MSTKIDNDFMSLEIDGRVITTAEFREHAAADGQGAWIVSCHLGRLSSRSISPPPRTSSAPASTLPASPRPNGCAW